MITRLSARRTSTFTSVRTPPNHPDELSLLRWSTSSLPPPPLSRGGPPSSPPPPSPFSSSLPPASSFGSSNPFSSPSTPHQLPPKPLRSPPPPIVLIKPKPLVVEPTPAPAPSPILSSPPPPPRPVFVRPPILQPSLTPLPRPAPEVVPPSKFEELLVKAREQTGKLAYQWKEKPQRPGMHNRRFKASLTTRDGTKLTTVDLQELGIRLAVMGRLKREFGVLEKVEFVSNPAVFTFPPVPSSTFQFTILNSHPTPPTARLKTSNQPGYLLSGFLPLPLASPPVGGPSLAHILQTAAAHPSNILRDLHPFSTNHQKVLMSDEEHQQPEPFLDVDEHERVESPHDADEAILETGEEPVVVSSRQFFIEITPDNDWNPSYVLDPSATFQTQYVLPPSSSFAYNQREEDMFAFEDQLWSPSGGNFGSFDGFSGGLAEARRAMGKRLGLRKGESSGIGENEFFDGSALRALPRAGGATEVYTRGRGGPFGDSPPVMGKEVKTRREGGLAGERVRVERVEEGEESGFEEQERGPGDVPLSLGRSSPFARDLPAHQPSPPSSLVDASTNTSSPSSPSSLPDVASTPPPPPSPTPTPSAP